VAALAALVRAVALAAADEPPAQHLPGEALDWSSFRAARDGTAAAILDGGALRPLPVVARETVTRLRPVARELGDEDALDGIERILEQGGGAGRQRRAYALGGFDEVLATLVADTAGAPAPLQRASRLWLDARSERDLERLAALTARDAVWVSPVDGATSGRDAVVGHVEAGFRETDAFATELLDFEARGNRAVARIRNVATRDGDELDSLQALVFEEAGGLVSSVRVVVDDPEAVEAFWEDG
ncbi:MAG TPA: nuclear transport factor 2 family protein, partial [Gaiella sp.]|nr:nuclear transport factor 2 family protein [Gaiella sp.]